MPSVRFEGRSTELQPGESVLEGLLRGGERVSHSCRAGACQSCLMRSTDGRPPEAAQVGLSDAKKARGYFLACLARPSHSLVIDLGDEELQCARVTVESIEWLSDSVVRVLLCPETAFDYRTGQFLTLIRDDLLARSYSLASLPGRDRHLELHVRVFPGGRMSQWLAHQARPGDQATVKGPAGDCFYVAGKESQEIVLVGTGTGLAPLFGIVQDALVHGHTAPMTLFHGARDPDGLYLVERLRELERRVSWFRYVPCCIKSDGREGVEIGSLDNVVLGRISNFAGHRIFLCGNPAMVRNLRKRLFLQGASIKDIYADAFLVAPAMAS